MVLIDTPHQGYSHMVADSIEELHKFAKQMDVRRCWFQNTKGKNQPHYDVKSIWVNEAIKNGAQLVERKELLNFLKKHYKE